MAALWAGMPGCGPTKGPVATFLPMHEAITLLNGNNRQVDGRVYGTGRWSGTMNDADGDRFSGNGQFRLHYARPNKLCFQARDFGINYFEAGCNRFECWFWEQFKRDRLILGTREDMEGLSVSGIPIQPDILIDSLGLQLIETTTRRPLYRVTPDYHQLIFEQAYSAAEPIIVKEYWLARSEPFLVERVVYRDLDGRAAVDARLRNHRPLIKGGPLVAHEVEIRWPLTGGKLVLDFTRLDLYPDTDSIWFDQPGDRPQRDDRHRAPREIVPPDNLFAGVAGRLP